MQARGGMSSSIDLTLAYIGSESRERYFLSTSSSRCGSFGQIVDACGEGHGSTSDLSESPKGGPVKFSCMKARKKDIVRKSRRRCCSWSSVIAALNSSIKLLISSEF